MRNVIKRVGGSVWWKAVHQIAQETANESNKRVVVEWRNGCYEIREVDTDVPDGTEIFEPKGGA